ncbi:adenylate/guanylate cyclase domain-containing protein [Bythopirellula polymerisocia]|uniref:Adenylate cyclase 1 n=1 Tax=Bythopirellula polymerisocia TaxID=2528003 RepID=A0A5C6CM05_9BACT|nr:adenylate/guanylate cyclase domain-containing protein [Bythopirellula polymerisocia]TWU24587.1 Adenylate cyclase 1 [Bythopirellula polymerisocia]
MAATMLDSSPPPFTHDFAPLLGKAALANFSPHLGNATPIEGPSSLTWNKWLTAISQLHRASADSPAFFLDAVRFAIETIGLDAACVLSYASQPHGGSWHELANDGCAVSGKVRPDETVLRMLAGNPVACYQSSLPNVAGVVDTQAVALAPVLDSSGELIGCIYGVRNNYGSNRRRGIRPFEARMLQVLAESVAVGIARIELEKVAARTRVLLEQAFSPTVVGHIQRHPECLAGQLREVTLLFSDLRGFTSLAETLPPAECYRLLGDVMEVFTAAVIDHAGIVVDYYGDGLLAMWNAPIDQAEQADLSCRAALAMFDALKRVSEQWLPTMQVPLEMGIGIHTGEVLVGNAGTKFRLKYGPRGSNVNLANRVQAATKQLETPLLITGPTQQKLSNRFFSLRVCTARLPGLEQPVELFAVYPASFSAEVKARLDQYSHALRNYEAGEFTHAEELLSDLVRADSVSPARFLAHQAATMRHAEIGRRASDKGIGKMDCVIDIFEK